MVLASVSSSLETGIILCCSLYWRVWGLKWNSTCKGARRYSAFRNIFFFWELLECGHRLTGSHALNFPNYNHHIHFYLQDNAKVGEVGVLQEDAHEHFEFSTKRDLEVKDKNSRGNLLTHPSSLWHLCPRQPPARMDHGLCSMSLHFHTEKNHLLS